MSMLSEADGVKLIIPSVSVTKLPEPPSKSARTSRTSKSATESASELNLAPA